MRWRSTSASPVREAKARAARMPFPIPYQQVNGAIAFNNMLRKQQCDFGWDWNIALGIFGVSGCVGWNSWGRGSAMCWSIRCIPRLGRGAAEGSRNV